MTRWSSRSSTSAAAPAYRSRCCYHHHHHHRRWLQMVPASSTPAQLFTRSAPAGAGATSRYTGKQGTVVAVDHARQIVTVSFQLGQMSCSLDDHPLSDVQRQLMIQSGFFTIPCPSCNPNHLRSAVFSGGGGGGGGGHGPRRGL